MVSALWLLCLLVLGVQGLYTIMHYDMVCHDTSVWYKRLAVTTRLNERIHEKDIYFIYKHKWTRHGFHLTLKPYEWIGCMSKTVCSKLVKRRLVFWCNFKSAINAFYFMKFWHLDGSDWRMLSLRMWLRSCGSQVFRTTYYLHFRVQE